MLMNREIAKDRWHIRPDGRDKVTGRLEYLTDLQRPGMLYGKILRSEYPHALIHSIRTDKAEQIPGVCAVVTHRDVPGMNRFGIAFPDQPVLCEDRVRYVGDAVAAVAAVSEEIAEFALRLIEVEYEPLPVVDDPDQALLPNAPKLHPAGNVLHRTNFKRGDIEEAFSCCTHVVEDVYYTPRQMHAYMETEGGLFIPEANGRLSVFAPTQHGYKDRMQLSRILAIPEDQIRVVSSPIGGSFGGKDELNIQPYGALLAIKSGCPVKIHQSRFESIRSGLKRHPMKITMKTGVDAQGKLIAHQVRILADTGAYATLGPAVLNFATEHCMGPYRIPTVDVEGISAYTNNGVSGEFRGFGGNQVIFALETQIERLAEAMNKDPWEFRKLNLRHKDDPGPLGQRIVPTNGAVQVWDSIHRSDVFKRKTNHQSSASASMDPWIQRGVGAAMAMHGSGLGFGIPDPAGGRLSLTMDGKIEVAFGFEEFGQGLLSTLEIVMLQHFQCAKDDLKLVIGDTDRVPHTGSSTASRATSMIWQALQRLKPPFVEKLLTKTSRLTGISSDQLRTGPAGIWRIAEDQSSKSYSDRQAGQAPDQPSGPVITYQQLAAHGTHELVVHTHFHFPTTPDAVMGGHFLHTFTGVAVEVEVNLLTGKVKVVDQFHAVAAGPVVNPMGYLGQIEGGSSMALGFTLTEDALMEAGRYLTQNLDSYLIPTIRDIPARFQLDAIEELPPDDPYGPRGVGEVGTIVLAPAIVSAIHDATGKWITRLPVSPESIVEDISLAKGVKTG